MKKIKIGLCFLDEEGNIVANRLLNSNWSVNIEQDLKEFKIRDEIAEIITETLKLELTKKVIREMLDELREID